jgi:uncharacterized protein (TIGR03437 family)
MMNSKTKLVSSEIMRYLCVFFLLAHTGLAVNFTHGQAARAVIGQPYFTAGLIGASQTVIGSASGLAYVNNMLFVADSNRAGASPINNRVLIYKNLSSQFPDPSLEPPNQGTRCPLCGGTASLVLGQPNFSNTNATVSQSGMSLPTAVATDGTVLAVADTNNNRVMIWHTIPTSNNTPADVVIGQADFKSIGTSVPPNAKSLRGPQGVWIQDGKLYIADTQDHRIMIYNSIPTANGVAADLVLGQPNFTTYVEPDLTQAKQDATANNLLNPVSVTSDGTKLFVSDLGHHRVLIWNSIPSQNQQPADVVVGQPDMTSSLPDNAFSGTAATTAGQSGAETPVLCTVSNGTDANSKPTYPPLCDKTLSFPRYALSDGNWFFIADGGNDRVLVYYHIPTTNAESPDIILGQPDGGTDISSNDTDSLATPMSLAWDGRNLFVSDTYNQRVMIYTTDAPIVPVDSVRNAASLEIFAEGTVSLAGTINAGDSVTITVGSKNYVYKVVKNDTFTNIVDTLANAINAGSGDPNVIAVADPEAQAVNLIARAPGDDGNSVTYSATVSTSAQITATAAGANLSGGASTAQVGPGSLITIYGTGLSEATGSDPGTGHFAPTEIENTRVYIDGSRAPLLYVSPKQINAQVPLYGADSASTSLYVWHQNADGTVTTSIAVPVNIVPQNPGIFAGTGGEPRPGLVFHGSQYATAVVSVDGTVKAGDVGTITISGRTYNYTVTAADTLTTITANLAALVNKDSQVTAYPAAAFTRIILQARKAGKAGVGIVFTASVNTGADLLLTAIGISQNSNLVLCCPNSGQVTGKNPAAPGETVIVYATGLGLLATPNSSYATGRRYDGPVAQPVNFVSSLAGGKTANVLEASPLPGSVGVWEVLLQLDSGLTSEKDTQLTIAQDIYVSNVVRFPVQAP